MRIIIAVLILMMNSPAMAETAADFIRSLAGDWRGNGKIYISEKAKNEPVRCKITSTLNEARKKLSNRGRCATAQRKARVSGSLGYSANSNQVTGAFLGAPGGVKLIRSSGVFKGKQLTLFATFQDEAENKVSQSRSVIRKISKRKFTITLFEKKNGSYLKRGKITFFR